MTPQQIEENLNRIKAELESEVSREDISAIQDKMLRLITFMGLSAEIMRYTKSLVLHKQQHVISANKSGDMSPSILKQYIESELSFELALHSYSERLNAAISHATDSLRSILSLYKTELSTSIIQR